MTTDNQDSGERDLRGLIAFIPVVFLFLLLFLVFRCEPFSVTATDDEGDQKVVSGEESFRRGGFWRRTWDRIVSEPTPIPDRGEWTITEKGVELVPKEDITPVPGRGVWTITKDGVVLAPAEWTITDEGVVLVPKEDAKPDDPVVVRSNEVPVPATATPVPAPTPTPESPSGVTASKLPSPDPDPTATSTPAPTAVPTPEPTAVKNVSAGGGGESAPTATPESAIEGPGDLTTPEEIPVELNFDIILERLTNQSYTPEIDFGNGGGFIPVEIIEKEDGSVAVEITAQYSDVGEYEGQLRLVNTRGEVITLDNFVVNVVPTLTCLLYTSPSPRD